MKKVLLCFFALTFVLQCTLSVSAEDYELSDWAREEITMPLEEFGIDNFKAPVTRKSFCEIVLKVLDAQGITLECSEPYEEHPFSDTDDENVVRLYNVKFIAYYSEKRVVQGKGDNTFAPDDYITRKDAAWILFRIYWYFNHEVSTYKKPAFGDFLDWEEMTGGSIDAIYILASKGVEVMYGEGNGGYFYPNHYLTGEQAVVASERLARVAKKFVQEKAER